MAATTTGANEAATSRGDPLMSLNNAVATTNDANELSDESFDMLSHTPFVHPASNQMGTTGGNFFIQGHASAPVLMSTGDTLPTSGEDFLSQGHASAPALTSTDIAIPTNGGNSLAQEHASAPNPTSTLLTFGHASRIAELEAAQWDDLMRAADDHISEFDDIHQYNV